MEGLIANELIGLKEREQLASAISEKCKSCSGYEEKINPKQYSALNSEIANKEKINLLLKISEYLLKDSSNENKHNEVHEKESSLDSPCDALRVAAELFEGFKYQIADYVLRHEFNQENDLSVHMTMWLDKQKQPDAFSPLKQLFTAIS